MVTVSSGDVLSFNHDAVSVSPPLGTSAISSYLNLESFAEFDGDEVTVDEPTGYIYGKIDITKTVDAPYSSCSFGDAGVNELDVYLDSILPDGDVTVHFAEELPESGDAWHFVIAEVSLDVDDVATVERQILTHNPTLHKPAVNGFT